MLHTRSQLEGDRQSVWQIPLSHRTNSLIAVASRPHSAHAFTLHAYATPSASTGTSWSAKV